MKTPPKSWPVLLLALPAFVAIWSGWVGLGGLTGFGVVHPLPGIWDSFSLNTAITLPIGVETYAAYALHVWLSPGVPARARRFARWSAVGSLAFGAAGQVAYHLMVAAAMTSAPWQITTAVACLPVAVLGMGASLAHLVRVGDEPEAAKEDANEDATAPANVPPPVDDMAALVDATSPATEVATVTPPAPATVTPQRPAKKTPTKAGTTAERVAAAVAKNPAITQAKVADLLDIGERTVQRHWPKKTTPAPINGHEVHA